MESAYPVNEVEQQLKETGEHLALPPSSTTDLLDLLDKLEQLLTFVGQAPSISMQGALVPSMGALISHDLMKHPNMDVRASVASCLCEVGRITAPEPPYKDETMKEIFQLNVMAFGELSNVTGRSYYKAIHILKSIAKVKSCVLMLDLECDDLVLEMFEQFLSRIRSNHPHTIFADMETIMTVVIEESDEIATELLSLLISHVRKENQNVSPAPWKLAEKVLRNCNDTLKSYSQTITKLIKSDPDDYAEVVTALCIEGTKLINTNNIHKRDANTLENGGSTKTLVSKKQKHIDAQIVEEAPKKIDRKGKELEAHETLSTKGRPKNKKNNLSQESRPNSVPDLKEDSRKTRAASQEKEKPKGKPEKQSTKTKSKIKKSDSAGPENNKISSKRKPSSGSRGKDLKGAGNLKKYGEELVGHRIKVWWPLDRMFYEGAVSSYDSSENKHKVLYADGDEEVLDLRHEKWSILDEISPDEQEQVSNLLNLSRSIVTSTKPLKPKGKRKIEFSQEDNSNSPKSSAAPADSSKSNADSSKTKPAKEDDTEVTKNPGVEPEISSGVKITESRIDKEEQESESGEVKEEKVSEEVKVEKNEELVCES